ncbi:MAG TPA: hypothetical protein VGM68_12070 [Rhizomicrobium sp.]|jgi:hypothetical protein
MARSDIGKIASGRIMVGAVAWIAFAVTAWFFMSATTRILTLSLLTGGAAIALVYELGWKHERRRWVAFSLICAWAIGTITLFIAERFGPQVVKIEGPLVAGAAPMPRTACDGDAALKSPDALLMVFGSDGVIGEGPGPFMPVRIGTCPAMRIAKTASGLTINGFGFDSDDNVVYRIRDNRFEQVIGGFLKGARPDKSTLAIVDERGREVAAIRYLNRHAVRISGTFRCGNTKPVLIAQDAVRVGGVPAKPNACAHLVTEMPFGIAYSDRMP